LCIVRTAFPRSFACGRIGVTSLASCREAHATNLQSVPERQTLRQQLPPLSSRPISKAQIQHRERCGNWGVKVPMSSSSKPPARRYSYYIPYDKRENLSRYKYSGTDKSLLSVSWHVFNSKCPDLTGAAICPDAMLVLSSVSYDTVTDRHPRLEPPRDALPHGDGPQRHHVARESFAY
jgi:hypothetical protein